MILSGSLVLFNNDHSIYSEAIESFLFGSDGFLYVIDNSPISLKSKLFNHPQVKYLHLPNNVGFGKAHNIAVRSVSNSSHVHLFLNPDVRFNPVVISEVLNFFDINRDVGAVLPRVNYPDGSQQFLCKLLPTPLDLIFRRFIPLNYIKNIINSKYELWGLPQDRPFCIPNLSGCCLFVRNDLLQSLGGFDERYFMYMEDVDLVRRIGNFADTVYLPFVEVIHEYAKGSYHNPRLLAHHLSSAFKYFNKWGWIVDDIRTKRNQKVLSSLSKII